MTVEQLIEKLKKMPKGMEVIACIIDGHEVKDVELVGGQDSPNYIPGRAKVMLS